MSKGKMVGSTWRQRRLNKATWLFSIHEMACCLQMPSQAASERPFSTLGMSTSHVPPPLANKPLLNSGEGMLAVAPTPSKKQPSSSSRTPQVLVPLLGSKEKKYLKNFRVGPRTERPTLNLPCLSPKPVYICSCSSDANSRIFIGCQHIPEI